jgi:hypothetical protein
MRDPWKPMIYSMLMLITFLLICNYALAGEKSKWLNENPCMIKIIIKEKCLDSQCLIKETTKEEVLKCNDGYEYTHSNICRYTKHSTRQKIPYKLG